MNQQPPSTPKAPVGGPASDTPVSSVDELLAHFVRGYKSPDNLRIGLEHEKIGIAVGSDGTLRPLPYSAAAGEPQISRLLVQLGAFGWQPVAQNGVVIALRRQGATVTLEPGGQFELSGPPLLSDEQAVADLDAHLAELLPLAESTGILFVGCGFRPLGTWDDVQWMPKGRYEVMREYLPTRSQLGVEMMKRTATVQANLDYTSEADAMDKMRLGVAVGPLVTAIYAASPLRDGQPCGYQSFRAACWLDTDPDRCGILPFLFRDGASFRDYRDWALDVPMFFVYRHGHYTPAGGLTFRRFLADGFAGERATLGDWELHLSTLFPEARLKQYVELRSADAGPLEYVRALPALWRGLFYSDSSRRAAWQLVSDLSIDERETLRREVPQRGLHTVVRNRPLGPLCSELLTIASSGLKELGSTAGVRRLEPLLAATSAGRCPADSILEAFAASHGDPRAFVERIRL